MQQMGRGGEAGAPHRQEDPTFCCLVCPCSRQLSRPRQNVETPTSTCHDILSALLAIGFHGEGAVSLVGQGKGRWCAPHLSETFVKVLGRREVGVEGKGRRERAGEHGDKGHTRVGRHARVAQQQCEPVRRLGLCVTCGSTPAVSGAVSSAPKAQPTHTRDLSLPSACCAGRNMFGFPPVIVGRAIPRPSIADHDTRRRQGRSGKAVSARVELNTADRTRWAFGCLPATQTSRARAGTDHRARRAPSRGRARGGSLPRTGG